MSWSRSGIGPIPPGPPGRPPKGPPGPPPDPHGPPALPPGEPHGFGPPLFEDMRTFLCDPAGRVPAAPGALADWMPRAISRQRAASRRPAYRPVTKGLQANDEGLSRRPDGRRLARGAA